MRKLDEFGSTKYKMLVPIMDILSYSEKNEKRFFGQLFNDLNSDCKKILKTQISDEVVLKYAIMGLRISYNERLRQSKTNNVKLITHFKNYLYAKTRDIEIVKNIK